MNIKEELLKLPEKILIKQEEIMKNKKEILGLEKQVNKIKNTLFEEILNAIDENGKAIYSNNEKRQIGLSKLIEDNDELQELYAKRDEYERENEEARIYISYLSDLQGNLRAICRLGGDE